MQHDGREQQDVENPQQTPQMPQVNEQDPPGMKSQPQETQEALLEQELEEARRKAEEYLDLLRRTQADFINYRRRTGQEQTEGRVTAQVAMLQQLVPVLDDLGRALTAAPPEQANLPWVQGVLLVARRLSTVLEQLGVRQIGKAGEQFDTRWHEALTTEKRSDVPEGTILQVTRPGYALGDRVIRPAQVVVASSASPEGAIHTEAGSHSM